MKTIRKPGVEPLSKKWYTFIRDLSRQRSDRNKGWPVAVAEKRKAKVYDAAIKRGFKDRTI